MVQHTIKYMVYQICNGMLVLGSLLWLPIENTKKKTVIKAHLVIPLVPLPKNHTGKWKKVTWMENKI